MLLYLQVDFILPLVQCPNYKDGLRVIFHIAVEHRFFKLRKGVGLNIVKVMVASLGLLASYERLKLKVLIMMFDVPYFSMALSTRF